MDKYAKLKPYIETDICKCKKISGVFLLYLFSENPFFCSECRKEIEPNRFPELDVELIEDIAGWLSIYAALYNLWLSSGEYESWAKKKLLDKNGEVNQSGMTLAKKLSKYHPTYYWWFWDTDDENPENCPNCDKPLLDDLKWGTGNCNDCRIII